MTSVFRFIAFASLAVLLPLAAAAISDPTPDPNAAVVLLRHTVHGGCGSTPLENCFETMGELVGTSPTTVGGWIWLTRNPSASSPLLVDIGPGTFSQPIRCDGTGTDRGYVTFRGSGREQTIVKGSNVGASIKSCMNLSFIDIGVHGGRTGVFWVDGGFSSWSNVDVVALGTVTSGTIIGWLDQCDATPAARSVHYFHGSRIRTLGVQSGPNSYQSFRTHCAETWIFGGELLLDLSAGSGFSSVVVYNGGGFIEVFGTAIRGRVSGSFVTTEIIGALVYLGGGHTLPIAFHSHGANFGLSTKDASQTNINVVAIDAQDDVTVHSPGTAYALSPGTSGSAIRVRTSTNIGGTPKVEAPFHWSAGTQPPAIASVKGEDLFVETDCTLVNCSMGGTEPHLMIYTPNCSPSPWWDVARNACRQ